MRILAPSVVGVLLLVCLVCTAQSAPQFHFQFTEQPGPYQPGFRVIEQYDRSRPFRSDGAQADEPRPLQTLVWYPAVAQDSPRMTVGDYAALIHTETSFGKPVEHGGVQDYVASFVQGTTGVAMQAVRDAAPVAGERFPLVLYAPSLNAPAFENIELCEYLASHGFVVVASPNLGASSRRTTADLAGAEAGSRDILFALNYAITLPNVDEARTAVIGYSWGAMTGLFAAAHDRRIRALVSLDGSPRYGPATVRQAGDVDPARMTIPLLVFSRAEEELESWESNHQLRDQFCVAPAVLNEWTHGDLYHLHMLAMSHIQFSSLYQRSARFEREGAQFSPADYSLGEGAESYGWVARYTLAFLEASLKQDAPAMAFLKQTPAQNGVPAHLISASFRAATAPGTPGSK